MRWLPSERVIVVSLPQYHADASYEIDVSRAQRASQVCDWLGHIAEKSWADPEVLGLIVLAFDQVVGLQGLK